MKTNIEDIVLCTAVIGTILCLCVGLVAALVPVTSSLLPRHHAVLDFVLALFVYGLLSAVAVRALLRVKPMRPGQYELDSPALAHWKLLTITYRLGQGALSPFTPVFLKPLVDALFGAQVGSRVAFGGVIDDPYMVSVGDESVLGHGCLVSANYISQGKLTCGPVVIGARVTIGANSVVLPDTHIGDGATLMGGSYVMPGTTIPAGETWRGNPARKWM